MEARWSGSHLLPRDTLWCFTVCQTKPYTGCRDIAKRLTEVVLSQTESVEGRQYFLAAVGDS